MPNAAAIREPTPTPAPQPTADVGQEPERLRARAAQWPAEYTLWVDQDVVVLYRLPNNSNSTGYQVGAAFIYHLPSGSAVDLYTFLPNPLHYINDEGRKRLEAVLADTALMERILARIPDNVKARGGPLDRTDGRIILEPTTLAPAIWYGENGDSLPSGIIQTRYGPAHCQWDKVTFLSIGWPLGTVAKSGAEIRQYVRDADGVLLQSGLKSALDTNAILPKDARFSGYRTGYAELWTSPSDVDAAVYLLFKNHAEKWPRSDPLTLCA